MSNMTVFSIFIYRNSLIGGRPRPLVSVFAFELSFRKLSCDSAREDRSLCHLALHQSASVRTLITVLHARRSMILYAEASRTNRILIALYTVKIYYRTNAFADKTFFNAVPNYRELDEMRECWSAAIV